MLGNIFRLLDRLLGKATNGTAIVGGWLYLVTALMVTYEVVMRGLFDAPTEWSLELSVYFVLVAGFLGLAATHSDDKNIRVDLFIDRLPAKWKQILSILTGLFGLIFAIVFFVESLDMTMNSFQLESKSTSTLRVPLYIPQLALPIGGLLLMLQFIRILIKDVQSLKKTTTDKQGGQL